jgi:heat shock protein HspQ
LISLNNSYQDPIENEFEVGQIVEHKIYEYRGLIVEIDPSCMASEDWYRSNQTQPEKNQPWYHILVDGAHHITYVAESNLLKDSLKKSVVHPMLNLFFFGIDEENNRYLRNDVPFDPGKPPDAPPPPPPSDIIPPKH